MQLQLGLECVCLVWISAGSGFGAATVLPTPICTIPYCMNDTENWKPQHHYFVREAASPTDIELYRRGYAKNPATTQDLELSS